MRRGFFLGVVAVAWGLAAPGVARAEERAVIQIPRDRYADPPPFHPPEPPQEERVLSPFRLHVGPWVATTGRGFAPGVGVAADFGKGTIGARLSAAWLRGEPSSADPSPIGGSLGLYSGEVTLDLARRGPIHPVIGVGFGYARVDSGRGAGDLGVGTARLGLEYALALDDADVRFSLGALGALPGPAGAATRDVKGWAMLGGSIGIGF